jgi:SOS regulatory protein LexA
MIKKQSEQEKLESHNTKIYDFYKKNRRMPSYAEVCTLFDVKSKDTAYKAVQKLLAAGYIETDELGRILPKENYFEHYFEKRTKHRSPIQFKRDLFLLGLVEAGFATPAEEQLLDRISLDDWMLPQDSTGYYMLQVKGDSMIDAGIRDSDMVIVERTSSARPGDIVVASVDGGFTIKYLREKDGKPYLQPANKDFEDIYPEESLEISAVLRSLVRKYD